MNNKALVFVKNFSYSLSANITALLISTLIVLIVPKLIGVQDYGYLQLYLFYASFVGFFQFGWNDGIYLRYGGMAYNTLDKKLLFSQFWMLTISQVILAIILTVASLMFVHDAEKQLILVSVALCMISMGVRAMLLLILQATNRIKEYALITIMEKIIYGGLILVFLIAGVRVYKLLIVADLIGKFVSFAYATYYCRDIVFLKISTFYFSFKEALENISVGINLMFANIASMLIIGLVRFGIERSWDVSTFGKVSLTLSVSSLMMLFINAIGIIMFPILRRTDEKKLTSIYVTLRDLLMVLLLGILMFYYPIKVVLSGWLPKYADSLMYMALVFPMCVYEGKMALLINTYLKTLRKERLMLIVNLISLALSLIITLVTTLILKNLNLAIVSIVILLAFKCALSEIFISKILKIPIYKDMVLEFMMTLIFILTGWFINSWLAVLFYAVGYIIYLLIKRRDISTSLVNVKVLTKG